MSPERTLKGAQTTTIGGGGITEDTPINLLLFSNMKKTAIGNLAQTSFGNTMTSNNNNYLNVILPLKNIIKTC